MKKLLTTAVVLALSSSAFAASPFLGDEYHGAILRDVQSRAVSVTAVQPGIGDREARSDRSVIGSARDAFVNPDLERSVLNDLGHDL